MNIFVVLDKGDGTIELATPPLEGTILPGITRLSLLELARGWEGVEVTAVRAPLPCVSWRCEVRSRPCLAVAASGACVACLQVSERNITLREMVEAAKTGRLLEAFGSGTAAVVSPVQRFKRASGEVLECARDMEGKDTLCWRLYEAVTAIQVGKTPHEWSVAFE